jgi:hypothetical protein
MNQKLLKIAASGVCVAAILVLSTTNTRAQNLLANPFFEQPIEWTPPTQNNGVLSYQNWTGLGGNGPGQQPIVLDMSGSPDSPPWPGNQALYVPSPAPGNYSPSGAYQVVAPVGGIIAGAAYTYSGYFLTDTGTTLANSVDLELGFLIAGPGNGFTDVGPDTASSFAPVLNSWTQGTVTAVAPARAEYALVYALLVDGNQTSTEDVYFDNMSLTVPEPSTLALLGMGLAAIPFYFIRRQKS